MKARRLLSFVLLAGTLLYADTPLRSLFIVRDLKAKHSEITVETVLPSQFLGLVDRPQDVSKGQTLSCAITLELVGTIPEAKQPTQANEMVLVCDHGVRIQLRQVLFPPVVK